jgi:hypothetical protein
MPTKSPTECEMKGLDGSNSARSTSQSGLCASLATIGENCHIHAGLCEPKASEGEPLHQLWRGIYGRRGDSQCGGLRQSSQRDVYPFEKGKLCLMPSEVSNHYNVTGHWLRGDVEILVVFSRGWLARQLLGGTVKRA